MLFHPFISVPRNDHLDEDIPGMSDDVGILDFPEEDTPACLMPSQPSRFPSSTGSQRPLPANQSKSQPQNSMPGWNMAKTMCQAGGGSGLEHPLRLMLAKRNGRDGQRYVL